MTADQWTSSADRRANCFEATDSSNPQWTVTFHEEGCSDPICSADTLTFDPTDDKITDLSKETACFDNLLENETDWTDGDGDGCDVWRD